MRNDMHKVIVEEPRWGHALRNHTVRKDRCRRRMLDAEGLDALPTRGALAPRDGLTKSFGEHLGPLRRFLMSRVGRPWDEVYSEIRRTISAASTVHMHILQHLFHYVNTRVELGGGEVYSAEPAHTWSGRRFPLWDNYRTFYVDPDSRLLCRPIRTSAPWRAAAPEEAPTRIDLGGGRFHMRLDGFWFCVETAPVAGGMPWDHVLRRCVDHTNAAERRRLFGSGDRYAARKRQLSRPELKTAGLS